MKFKCILILIIVILMTSLEAQPVLHLTLQQAETMAIHHNYRIQASFHRLQQGYHDYYASKSQFYPNVSFSSSVDINQEQRGLDAALSFNQPLYDKVASYAIKESQIQWEQLRLDMLQQICQVLFQVREAYHEILLYQSQLAVDEMIIQIWQDENKRQERLLELGTTTLYDLNQMHLNLKNAWIDLYATQKDIKASQIKLLTVLGLPSDIILNLLENDIICPDWDKYKESMIQWKNIALQYRPEIKQQQLNILLSQNKIKQIKAENKPKISFYANAGHRYINNGFDRQPYVGVGLNVDWMLYHPAYQQRIKQAQQGNQVVTLDYRQIELEATAEVLQLMNEIEQFYQTYLTAKEGADLAKEGIQLATKKHQLGVMSAFEYRDAVKTLREAEQNVNQAKFDLRYAYDKLVQQTGFDLQPKNQEKSF